jgi:WS/DGAT/MGAT family acyltransferase
MDHPIPMLDLMFFLTETQDNPRHVGSVLIFRKPRRGGARCVQQIVDAYRRVTPQPPFNRIPVFRRTGLPMWHEVEAVDPRRHVLHLALPAPGSDEQLHQLVADLHAPMLERHRPGWKVYVIDGLAGDRFAIYHKCHHALVDGESGIAILRQSLATSPRDRRIRTTIGELHALPRRSAPHGLRDMLEAEAGRLARRAMSLSRSSLLVVESLLEGLSGYSRARPRAFTAPLTPMNEPIQNARSITHLVLPLAAMKRVAHARGATLNDVALCILDAGINRHLKTMGRAPDHPLVALVPISLRNESATEATTMVSAIWPTLGPVSATVDRRLRAIVESTRREKDKIGELGKDAAYAFAVMAFATAEAIAIAQPETLGLRPANMLISNVRGPERTLYLNGAKLEAMFPLSTLIVAIGLNVTFMSYAGKVIFGFTANGASLPEVESLARHTAAAFDSLQRATTSGTPASRRPRRSASRAQAALRGTSSGSRRRAA